MRAVNKILDNDVVIIGAGAVSKKSVYYDGVDSLHGEPNSIILAINEGKSLGLAVSKGKAG